MAEAQQQQQQQEQHQQRRKSRHSESEKKPTTDVLIAVDGSKHSDYAVKWYANNLHRPEFSVLLVHVAEPDFKPAQAVYGGMSLPKEEWECMVNEFKIKEGAMRTKYIELLQSRGVTHVRFACIYGKPGESLVHAAAEHNCVMVVVGTRGMGTVRRTIMGSISGYVLHHSHVPVVVCEHKH